MTRDVLVEWPADAVGASCCYQSRSLLLADVRLVAVETNCRRHIQQATADVIVDGLTSPHKMNWLASVSDPALVSVMPHPVSSVKFRVINMPIDCGL